MTVLAIHPAANIGRLLDAEQVAAELFNGHVTRRWVMERLHEGRVKLTGRKVLWSENAVNAWIAEQMR